MAKRGRPLKIDAARYPSGKIKPKRLTETAIYWQRERDSLRASSRLPEWESPFGVMFRHEVVSATQYAAGKRFAEAREAYAAALSMPPLHPPAQNMNAVPGASNREDGDSEARRKQAQIEAYDKACIVVGIGSAELAALSRIIVDGLRPDDYQQVMALKAALNKLVQHYGMR